MKYLLACAFMISCQAILAQRQNVYFFKNNGRQVTHRDSADYTRVVREPDSGSVLYKVLEYYLDGRPRRMALSSSIDPIRLEGACIEYYDNDKRRSVLNYSKGVLVNDQYYYYPNGKLGEIRKYPVSQDAGKATFNRLYLITAFNDTSGVALVTNGNGHYKGFDVNHKKTTVEGDLKNGLREGEWTINVNRDSLIAKEIYSNGKLVTATARLANGESYAYTQSDALPEFKGGTHAFGQYLNRTLRYPSDAVSKRVQGRVMLTFVIEKDGTVTDIKSLGTSPGESLTAEAIRVIKESPKWTPGVQYGRPVRATYTVPIVFTLQ